MTWNFDIAAPRQTVWEHFTVPGRRQKWWPADGIIENSSDRRRGIGTENHCMHGKDAIVEEVLDWRPFDYFTVSTLLPIPGAPKIILTHAFQDRINGVTHIEMRVAKPKPKDVDWRPNHPRAHLQARKRLLAHALHASSPGYSATAGKLAETQLRGLARAAAQRLHPNVLAAALANKLARIAWTVLAQERSYEARVTKAAA